MKLAFGYGRVGGASPSGFLALFAFFTLHTGSQGSATAGDAATAIATATSAVVRPSRRSLLIVPGQYGTPKSKRSSRAVPLADRVAGELERHFQRSSFQGDDDLVFTQTGQPLDASKLRKRFKAALGRAGVREVRFHDLRHTFGTRMAAAGAPIRAIQEWMGHASITTTEVYADFAPDPSQGASWAQRAFGAGTNSGTNLSATEGNSEHLNPL